MSIQRTPRLRQITQPELPPQLLLGDDTISTGGDAVCRRKMSRARTFFVFRTLLRTSSRSGGLAYINHRQPALIKLPQCHRSLCQNITTTDDPSTLSAAAAAGATPQEPPAGPVVEPTLVKFSNGFFKFNLANQQLYVVSYWTPIDMLPVLITGEVACPKSVPDFTLSSQDTSTLPQEESGQKSTVKVIDMNNFEMEPATLPTALGFALSESNTILLEFTNPVRDAIRLQFDGLVGDLKSWEAKEVPPQTFEAQVRHFYRKRKKNKAPKIPMHVLEKERMTLLSTYGPMSEDFKNILNTAETQANSRFKWGGLFLLSAQLGFVARLTWFEYSWDIMEPITWCLTYSMLMASFAYYIMTSQEYMLPLVERRVIQNHFWKNVKKNQFNVEEFKKLRQQLLTVEEKMGRSKSPYASMSKFPF